MSSPTDHANSDLSPEAIARMEEFGITRERADYFYVGGYRYTQLKDAIAQAQYQRGLK